MAMSPTSDGAQDVDALTILFYESLPESLSQSMNYYLPSALRGFPLGLKAKFFNVALSINNPSLSVALVRAAFLINYFPDYRAVGLSSRVLDRLLSIVEKKKTLFHTPASETFSYLRVQTAKYGMLSTSLPTLSTLLNHIQLYSALLDGLIERTQSWCDGREAVKVFAKMVVGAHLMDKADDLPFIYSRLEEDWSGKRSELFKTWPEAVRTLNRVKERRIKRASSLYKQLNSL